MNEHVVQTIEVIRGKIRELQDMEAQLTAIFGAAPAVNVVPIRHAKTIPAPKRRGRKPKVVIPGLDDIKPVKTTERIQEAENNEDLTPLSGGGHQAGAIAQRAVYGFGFTGAFGRRCGARLHVDCGVEAQGVD